MEKSRLATSAMAFLLLIVIAAPGNAAPVSTAIGDDLAASFIVLTNGDAAPVAERAVRLGADVTWTYTIIDGFAARMPGDVLETLAADPAVVSIHPDRPVEPLMDVSHRAIGADKAWAAGATGAGVTVAVIDTGIDILHPFFAGALVSCVSTIGGLVSPECTDSDGHGTHVAGTVASRDDTYPGVAPGASLAIVRVLHVAGAGTSSDIIAGMDWVAANRNNVNPPIRVATMSIGFLSPGCGDDSSPEAKAANALVDAGVFFSVAAGNSGHKKCTIDGASAATKVLTVAAVDDKGTVTQDDDVIADFSSGGGNGLQKPDVSFPGVAITSAFIGAGTLIATLDGTSMATPHAAGTAALVFQAEPALTATQVKDRITGTAVKNQNTGNAWNSVYGHGLGNACTSLKLSTCGSSGGGGGGGGDPGDFPLSATGYKVKGIQHADLAWSGATGTTVEVLRNGVTIATTANDGTFTDNIGKKGGGSYVYKVCVAGTSSCSNEALVTF